jgi:hypothetical protein
MTLLDTIRWLRRGKLGTDANACLAPTPSASASVEGANEGERAGEANGFSPSDGTDTEFRGTDAAVARCQRWSSVDEHVTQLLEVLIEGGLACRMVPHDHLRDLYVAMCGEFNWLPHPWNHVAKAFKAITTGRKVYQRFKFADGKTRKVRVYPVVIRQPDTAVVTQLSERCVA